MQIEHGDHDPAKHTSGYLLDYIEQYIPNHVRQLQDPEVWEADLIKTHSRMHGAWHLTAITRTVCATLEHDTWYT